MLLDFCQDSSILFDLMTGLFSKFIGPDQIVKAIEETRLLVGRVKLVIGGGVAMQAYGSDRLTKDVDFVAKSLPGGLPLGKKLSFGGLSTKTPSGIPICIIVRSDDYESLYREAFERSVRREGIDLIAPEYLAAMKLVAGRTKDELDLLFLLMNNALRLPRARAIIKKHLGAYALDDFNSRLMEAEWRRKRDSRLRHP